MQIPFHLIVILGYLTATNVTINLPAAAQKAATTLRWRQLTNSGSNLDEWAIDDIQILRTDVGTTPTAVPTTPTLATIFLENFDTTPTVPYNHTIVSHVSMRYICTCLLQRCQVASNSRRHVYYTRLRQH